MTAVKKDLDRYFFHEWVNRAPGAVRSLSRAFVVAEKLGLTTKVPQIIEVVGSKGKGTTATYVSAVLSASGLKVVTVTSPAFIQNNERIRLNGTQVSDEVLNSLGEKIREAADAVPREGTGYLSPTGAFTLAGVLFAIEVGADVLVLEEGLGGKSDEISLFEPDFVAVTRIFLEHQGILGNTIDEICEDLLGVVRPRTRCVATIAQSPEVAAIIDETSCEVIVVDSAKFAWLGQVEWPAGLSKANAALGIQTGLELLKSRGLVANPEKIRRSLNSLILPGRLSFHKTFSGAEWIVDAAIDADGIKAALEHCGQVNFVPTIVLASFPDDKHVDSCYEALRGLKILPIAADSSHLSYKSERHPRQPVKLVEALRDYDRQGQKVLAVGTISFVGEVLHHVGADLGRLFATNG